MAGDLLTNVLLQPPMYFRVKKVCSMSQMALCKQALVQNTLINPKLILQLFWTLRLIQSIQHLLYRFLKQTNKRCYYSCNLIHTLAKYNLESDAHSHKWGRLSVTSNQSLHLFNCSTKDKTRHSDP